MHHTTTASLDTLLDWPIITQGWDAITDLATTWRAGLARQRQPGRWCDHFCCGRALPCSPRKNLTELAVHELAVYHQLTDPEWTRVRRIEQEKIPLADGLAAVSA